MDKNRKMALVFLLLAIIGLFILFFYINFIGIKNISLAPNTTKAPELNEVDNYQDIHQDSFIFDNRLLVLNLREYQSNNFKMDYDVDNFNVIDEKENEVIFQSKLDENIFIKVNLYNSDTYYQEYEKYSNNMPEYENAAHVQGYDYSYSFLKANNVYLRVLISLKDDADYQELNARINYMFTKIYVTGK